MLDQLYLNDTCPTERKPNVIGNAEEVQTVSVVNLNSGKNKKVGLGVYNLDSRVDQPKMPRLSKKRE